MQTGQPIQPVQPDQFVQPVQLGQPVQPVAAEKEYTLYVGVAPFG